MMRRMICALLALMLCVSLAICVYAASAGELFLIDDADLLTASEETALIRKLEEVSHAYDAQFVIVTVPNAGGFDVESFADGVYDTCGFGYGERRDGAMLLVCMDPRRYQILTNGYISATIGSHEIDQLCDIMDTHLPEGEYAEAFVGFAEACAVLLEREITGEPFPLGLALIISLAIGLTVGLIVALVLKGQLKSVRQQYRAHDYVKPGSMRVDVRHDIFLYRTVTRVKRENNSGSHGRSSGGSSRSSGGGSF